MSRPKTCSRRSLWLILIVLVVLLALVLSGLLLADHLTPKSVWQRFDHAVAA